MGKKVFFIDSKVGINSQISLTAHKSDTTPNNPPNNQATNSKLYKEYFL